MSNDRRRVLVRHFSSNNNNDRETHSLTDNSVSAGGDCLIRKRRTRAGGGGNMVARTETDLVSLASLSRSSSSSSSPLLPAADHRHEASGKQTHRDATAPGDDEEIDRHRDVDLSKSRQPLISSASMISSGGEGSVVVEARWAMAVQVFVPYMIAGMGMVGAGIVLDVVQHWPVFGHVSELFILVPALLGLKGNLEMTLASRLSTQANLGYMDEPAHMWSLLGSNMGLIQCQAIAVGFLASAVAVLMGWIPDGEFDMRHSLLLCSSSVATASLASFLLGLVMMVVIVLSHRWHINPDNVATPIAASMGDLVTLVLLASISSLLFNHIGKSVAVSVLIIVVFVVVTPVFVWVAWRNKLTRTVLYDGWTPVIAAMFISSAGGLILDFAVSSYQGIAVFQPVINGVGGNLAAVQASRMSTALHSSASPGHQPSRHHTTTSTSSASTAMCQTPCRVFCSSEVQSRTARVLLCMVVPGHLVFTYCISYLRAGHTSLTATFLLVYICAAMLQVVLLLYVTQCMIHHMWSIGVDPDNSAIPYLTAFGDLLGTGLLALAFQILYMIGDKDSDVGD